MTEMSYREMKIYQFENTEMNLFGFEGFFLFIFSWAKLHEPAVLGMNNYHFKCFDLKKAVLLNKEEGQMSYCEEKLLGRFSFSPWA